MKYNHFKKKSIIDEMFAIIKCEKDTVKNIENLKKYMEKEKTIDLQKVHKEYLKKKT